MGADCSVSDMPRFGMLVDQFVDYVTASSGGEYHVMDTDSKRFAAPPSVVVDNANGDVAVRGEERDDLRLAITWHGTDLDALETARVAAYGGDDEPLRVTVEHDDAPHEVAVDLEFAVPRSTRVDRLETKNGDVRLTEAAGDARLATENGSITAEHVDGRLDLRATNGRISVADCPGIERVETKTGAIELRLDELRLDATVSTATGQVTLELDPAMDADLRCETKVGTIDAPLLERSLSGIGTASLVEPLGDGGPELAVEASVGSVLVTAPETADDDETPAA